MHAFVTSKNVKWCHLIWPTLYIIVQHVKLYSVIERLRDWTRSNSEYDRPEMRSGWLTVVGVFISPDLQLNDASKLGKQGSQLMVEDVMRQLTNEQFSSTTFTAIDARRRRRFAATQSNPTQSTDLLIFWLKFLFHKTWLWSLTILNTVKLCRSRFLH